MPTSQSLRVILKKPGELPEVAFLPSGLAGAQSAVGGLIDVVRLAPGLDLVINEEGLIHGLPTNFLLVTDDDLITIVGAAFLVAVDEEGAFQSLTAEQAEQLERRWVAPDCFLAPEN
jgi:hypothetical protein